MKVGLFLFLKKKTATTPIDTIDFAQTNRPLHCLPVKSSIWRFIENRSMTCVMVGRNKVRIIIK